MGVAWESVLTGKDMAFNEEIKIRALTACKRSCCICHKFCGQNIELHHIKAKADGGKDTFENAIPLCFDCHAQVRQYDSRHPKGTKYTEAELIRHRDLWYEKVKEDHKVDLHNDSDPIEPIKFLHQKGFKNIKLYIVTTGKELLSYFQDASAMEYDHFEPESVDEVNLIGDFIAELQELLDCQGLYSPSERVMCAFALSDKIKVLKEKGILIFCGVEQRLVAGGVLTPQNFPTVLVRIVRNNDDSIIRH